MGQPLPTKDPQPNGLHAGPHLTQAAGDSGRAGAALKEKSVLNLKFWDGDESVRDSGHPLAQAGENGAAADGAAAAGHADLVQALTENAELRTRVVELEHQLEALSRIEQGWATQQQEYESLLEEKSEVIRSLHQKVQELEDRRPVAPLVPKEEELLALSDELERERCQLQQERRGLEEEMMQLKEDEEALMKQMREMEVQMSRERAELARQRNELQRLNADIRHELELAQRDAALRERLMPLQRRHHEMMNRKGAAPTPDAAGAQQPPQNAAPPAQSERNKDSGLLRRIFR